MGRVTVSGVPAEEHMTEAVAVNQIAFHCPVPNGKYLDPARAGERAATP